MTAIISQPPISTLGPDGLGQNGGRIDLAHIDHLRPTPSSLPIEEMRQRFQEDGYLFVKGLIPREDVLDMREHYFSPFSQKTTLLEPNTSPRLGIFNSATDPDLHKGIGGAGLPADPLEQQILVDAHSDPRYRAFIEHPALTGFICKFMCWKEHHLLDRSMLRHNVPGGLGTGIHYDKLFLRGGEGFFLTAWVPIGDISINGGGLCYLSNAVSLGEKIENDYTAKAESLPADQKIFAYNMNMMDGGLIAQSPQQFDELYYPMQDQEGKKEHRWLVTNYEAGDVVFHHPHSIHASGRNEDADGRIRLSTDLRFYEKGDKGIDTRWFKIWTPDDRL